MKLGRGAKEERAGQQNALTGVRCVGCARMCGAGGCVPQPPTVCECRGRWAWPFLFALASICTFMPPIVCVCSSL